MNYFIWHLFLIIAFSGIIVGIALGVKDENTLDLIEQIVYLVTGIFFIFAGLIHIFFKKQSNEAVGIPNNGYIFNQSMELFRLETGVADIVVGIPQIIVAFNTELQLLALIVVCSWGWLLAFNHLSNINNPEAYLPQKFNTMGGLWPFYASIFFPALLLTLYFQ